MNLYLFWLENQFFIVIGILVFLIIILFLKQRKLKKELNLIKMQILRSRTKREIKKDIGKVKRDLGALEILHEDNLLPKDYYVESRTQLDESLNLLEEEIGKK